MATSMFAIGLRFFGSPLTNLPLGSQRDQSARVAPHLVSVCTMICAAIPAGSQAFRRKWRGACQKRCSQNAEEKSRS